MDETDLYRHEVITHHYTQNIDLKDAKMRGLILKTKDLVGLILKVMELTQ